MENKFFMNKSAVAYDALQMLRRACNGKIFGLPNHHNDLYNEDEVFVFDHDEYGWVQKQYKIKYTPDLKCTRSFPIILDSLNIPCNDYYFWIENLIALGYSEICFKSGPTAVDEELEAEGYEIIDIEDENPWKF